MLEVRTLSAGYGRAQVLFQINLEVKAGEVVALLGRNGAGKSTALKAIMGLIPRWSGDILFENKSLENLEPHAVARLGLGYVPEDRRIFTGLAVAENLEVGRRPGAWDEGRVFSLFPRLKEVRERPAAHLSGGEQKMLAIARTLMGNPLAILLDEPSEGLAPLVVRQMAQAIGELRRAGLGVLLCEQNARFAEPLADRGYRIEKGRIRPA